MPGCPRANVGAACCRQKTTSAGPNREINQTRMIRWNYRLRQVREETSGRAVGTTFAEQTLPDEGRIERSKDCRSSAGSSSASPRWKVAHGLKTGSRAWAIATPVSTFRQCQVHLAKTGWLGGYGLFAEMTPAGLGPAFVLACCLHPPPTPELLVPSRPG